MSQLYARVFVKILDSSIAEDFRMRHVFEDFLKLADFRTGVVDITRQALARKLNIPIDILNEEIAKLEAPDDQSRDDEYEGRRLVRLDEHRNWGWKIVNWERYEMIKKKADHASRMSTYRKSDPQIDAIWAAYPRKVGKPVAVPKIRAAIEEVGFDKLLETVTSFAKTKVGEDPQFTPHPSTWFHQKRYNDPIEKKSNYATNTQSGKQGSRPNPRNEHTVPSSTNISEVLKRRKLEEQVAENGTGVATGKSLDLFLHETG